MQNTNNKISNYTQVLGITLNKKEKDRKMAERKIMRIIQSPNLTEKEKVV